MAKISGKDTKPEIQVRKFLFSQGFRYRKNVKSLPGKPDIVLPKFKTVIFVSGCFWHGHSCKAAKLPETRKEFWKTKIEGNKKRDETSESKLRELGWKVIVIWQCEIKSKKTRESLLNKLVSKIKLNYV